VGKARSLGFALLVAASVLAPGSSHAATLTFVAAADSYVLRNNPTANFGSATTLQVDFNPDARALLRFNVAGIGAGRVTSAKLRLWNVNASNKGGDFSRLADTPWTESTVNWNSAPAAVGAPFASLGAVSSKRWFEVDVTSIVTRDGTYGFGITTTSTDGADYTSRQGTAANTPRIVVTYDTAPSDTTAPGVSITSPSPGATVGATVGVQSSASDAVGVTRVEHFVDGALANTDTSSPYGFSWNTKTVSNGAHSLQAKAYDAAGNVGTSAAVPVTVDNPPDTQAPTAPSGLTADAPGPTRVNLSWTASTDNEGVTGYRVFRDGTQIGTSTSTSYADTTVSASTTYEYQVRAVDAAGNPSDPSNTATVTTPAAPSTISFAAAGDHGANTTADASLRALDQSGVNFYLALGDLDYDQTPSDEAWCDYVKARLPTLGSTFPFQLVSGNHEEQGGSNGNIVNHAACLPDRMGSTLSPTNQYAAEYYFDYPSGAPLVRVIMIAADLPVANVTYDYFRGNAHYNWLAGAIDSARGSGIPWVVVGMHKNCITTGDKGCEIGTDLMNLLVEKKVDLVLQAHDHNYQRSKQLALNPSTCPAIPAGSFDADCVVDSGADREYPKGQGTLFQIGGTFGRGLYPVSASDSEAGYFAMIDSTTWGFLQYTVSATRIEARFVNSLGPFTESWSIVGGPPPPPDDTAPSAPTGLQAVASSSQVNLSWTASTDNVGVTGYAVFRDGTQIATAPSTSYSDTGVSPSTTYSYVVKALDARGNISEPSNTVAVTTSAGDRTVTLNPSADTYVLKDSPTSNFGTQTSLQVDNSPVKHTLMKFDISGIGPGAVVGAKLRIHITNGSDRGGDFFQTGSSWTETGVNFNNAPAPGAPVGTLGPVTSGLWYEVPLTGLSFAGPALSLKVTSISGDGTAYDSREAAASLRPQLILTIGG
jgi:chitodextrinase